VTAELDAEYEAIITVGQAAINGTRPTPGSTHEERRRS